MRRKTPPYKIPKIQKLKQSPILGRSIFVSRLQEIMEKRAKVHADAVVLINKPEQTNETRAQIKAMLADVDVLGEDIATIQRSDKMAAELAAKTGVIPAEEQRGGVTPAEEYRDAYFDFMQHGRPNGPKNIRGGASAAQIAKLEAAQSAWTNMNEEQRRVVLAKQAAFSSLSAEKRDQQAGTQSITYTEGNLGGYFVPAGFVYDIEQATKFYANLMDGSSIRIMETATGNVLPYPTSNDTNEAWTLLSETTQIVDNGTTPNYPVQGGSAPAANPGNVLASQVTFGAYKGSTGLVRVSLELMQDSAFSLEAFLKEAFAVRLGRGYEYYLTLGSGSNAPLGIIPAIAASGATAVTAAGSSLNDGVAGNTGANSIGYQDIVNLIHSVDPEYRRGAKFMFHDQTLASLKTRVDKFGRPLWVPSVKDDAPDTLCGYPYVINQSIAQIAPSATTVAFGLWSKFVARKVRDLSIVRLDERFADYGEVAYVGFSRIDSRLVDAGTHPLNCLIQHS
jgi:HK97 family phage major capsid protein